MPLLRSAEPQRDWLIRRDQLDAVRRSVLSAIPINALLGLAGVFVAAHADRTEAGLIWFAASSAANLLRVALCRARCPGLALTPATPPEQAVAAARSIDRHLRLSWLAALLSGTVWAFLPLLCAGYTSPQAMFYLIVTCGITAGAVSYGAAFARIPACFLAPPLLSAAGCLLYAGGFDRTCLAATVLLYLAALTRSAVAAEAGFRKTIRLKHEATALAEAHEAAHASARALAETMRLRATHDALTGLLNRAGFAQAAEGRLAAQPCLMLLDLDGFKSVNDIYGHTVGDRLLAEVGRRLAGNLPPGACAARLGGDEFALLYDPAASDCPPDHLAARLIGRLAEPFESFDRGRLGLSIGICQVRADSLTHLLTCADQALYAAKAAGRNSVRLFDAGLLRCLEMRRDCERDLSRALAEGGLAVWFQPIFGEAGRRVASLEALVRWRHPVHGWIPPGDLIAAASAAGLTESLLRFILEQVCAMMLTLRERGLGDVRVAMNVSPREMAQIAVDEIVLERLGALGLPHAMLEIEITEETALDIEATQGKLAALSQAGIRLALDDFGVGYSALASLRALRADRIKIDRSLVTGLAAAADKRGLVQAVLGLGRALGLDVVAEGVETAEDLATLEALGCRFLQGYHLGRPAPADATLAMMADRRADAA